MLGVIIHMAFLETMLYPSLSNVGIITHLFFCFIGSTGLLTATSGSKKDPLFLFAFVFYGFNGGYDNTYVTARVYNLGLTINF